ncbi:MAG: NlpC/P60 family protein [Actinocrinis sp.]
MASHRRVRRRRNLLRTTGLAAATAAAVGLAPSAGHADPLGAPPGTRGPNEANGPAAVRQQVGTLYQQAEAATQQYDAAAERIASLQAAVANAGSQAALLRGSLNQATAGLGRLAAEQYRNEGLSPSMDLMFSAHPDNYLERAGVTDRIATVDRQRVLAALRAQQALANLQNESAADLSNLRTAQEQASARKAEVEARLTAARNELSSLSAGDRSQVTAALARGNGLAPGYGPGLGTSLSIAAPSLQSLLSAITSSAGPLAGADGSGAADGRSNAHAHGAHGRIGMPGADRAVTAVETAYSELGKPYVWGATGPGEFDCSGLTQHAWAAAGVQLPRTSQEQAGAGQSVPVSEIRPGDLVVYFSGRTHIGMYVGRGLVIHAPHPGAVVQFAPLQSMPIDKVVRPTE